MVIDEYWAKWFSLAAWASSSILISIYIIDRILNILRGGFGKKMLLAGILLGCLGISGLLWLFSTLDDRLGWLTIIPVLTILFAFIDHIISLNKIATCSYQPERIEGNRISAFHPITTTDLRTMYFSVKCPNWHGKNFRVAHVSDFHITSQLPISYYLEVIEKINQQKPDLILITGDFVTDKKYIDLIPVLMAHIHNKTNVFATLGNHDYWVDSQAISDILVRSGCRVLQGTCCEIILPIGKKSYKDQTILLCGDDAPWGKSFEPHDGQDYFAIQLILSHTPDNYFKITRAISNNLASQNFTKVFFSGHLHGGQIRFPGLGPIIVPSIYGKRLLSSGFLFNNLTYLFVSSGIGAAEPPLRIFCQPDILIVDFKSSGATTSKIRQEAQKS